MFFFTKPRRVRSKTLTASASFVDGKYDNLVASDCAGMTLLRGGLTTAQRMERIGKSGVSGCLDVDEGLCLATPNGIVFVDASGVENTPITKSFSNPVFLHCPKRTCIFLSQKGVGTYFWATNKAYVGVKISDMGFDTLAYSRERLFGAVGNQLYVSQRTYLDYPWGTISLPQNVTCLAEYKDDLYAFGKDVYKIFYDNNNEDCKVQTVVENIGNVVAKTVAVVGDKLVFMTDKGLFRFSQNALQQIATEVDFGQSVQEAFAAAAQNSYYVAYTDRRGKRVLLVLDGDLQVVCKYYVDLDRLSGGKRLLCIANGEVFAFGEERCRGFWKSRRTNLAAVGKKHFKTLTVDALCPVDVHLVTESERKIYHFDGAPCAQRLNVSGSFEYFSAEIFAEGKAEVASVTVTARLYGQWGGE